MQEKLFMSEILLIDGHEYPLDEAGYLLNTSDWSQEFTSFMAAREELVLEDAHWQVIGLVRAYYARYDDSPPMRALVKLVRRELGDDKGNSRYLYQLFPDGPGKQASLLAGLPKPVSCI